MMATSYNTLTLGTDGAVALLTLNRPEKRNALSPQLIEELLAALETVESNGAIRVLILTGAGQAFCSGMDLEYLKGLAGQSAEQNLADARRTVRMFRRLWSFSKPLITAVNGAAMAGGCGIATLGDFTLASEDAKFGYTEVRVGFIPALISAFLQMQVGEKVARDLLLSGRVFDAAEAHVARAGHAEWCLRRNCCPRPGNWPLRSLPTAPARCRPPSASWCIAARPN